MSRPNPNDEPACLDRHRYRQRLRRCDADRCRPSSAAMASRANAFLAGLTATQRAQATFPFEGDERTHWHFIPTEMFPRHGLTIKEMTRAAAHGGARALQDGSEPARLPDGHRDHGARQRAEGDSKRPQRAAGRGRGQSLVRDPERYFFSIFGTPSTTGTWGWRVEGHHVSLQFTVVNGTLVAASPTFFGANPAEVREGPKHGHAHARRVREDAARALVDVARRRATPAGGLSRRGAERHRRRWRRRHLSR